MKQSSPFILISKSEKGPVPSSISITTAVGRFIGASRSVMVCLLCPFFPPGSTSWPTFSGVKPAAPNPDDHQNRLLTFYGTSSLLNAGPQPSTPRPDLILSTEGAGGAWSPQPPSIPTSS